MKTFKIVVVTFLILMLISGCGTGTKIIEREDDEAEDVKIVVPEGMALYESPHGYSVICPESWQTITGKGKVSSKNSNMDFFTQEGESGSNISIDTVALTQSFYEITAESFVKGMSDLGYEVEMIEFFRGLRNGIITLEMTYSVLGNTVTQIYFVNDSVCHSLAYTQKPGTDESVCDMMENVIESFKILK